MFSNYFSANKNSSAALAKERLQIIVAHERKRRNEPDYLPQMQQDIIEAISKYIEIDNDTLEVQMENKGTSSVLELNVTLPN